MLEIVEQNPAHHHGLPLVVHTLEYPICIRLVKAEALLQATDGTQSP